jgi:MarR-like DNA-binding transcriptional regulator SgrR of sgrS sRNA
VPIYHYVQTLIVSPRVKGLWVNGLGVVDFMKIRLQ